MRRKINSFKEWNSSYQDFTRRMNRTDAITALLREKEIIEEGNWLMGEFDRLREEERNKMKGTPMAKEKCKASQCDQDARWDVFWPGQETKSCDEHAIKQRNLAFHMGFSLSVREILPYEEIK